MSFTSIRALVPRPLLRLGVLASVVTSALPAWAQAVPNACQLSIGYAPVIVPPPAAVSSVPGLTMTGIGLLAAVLGAAAWKYRDRAPAGKVLAVFLAVGAMTAFVQSGDSFITAVRAAAPYELSDANGGTLADSQIAFASPSPLITVSNTSGKRMRITSNGNTSETGTCVVGSELAPGASCTTQAVCPVVPPVDPVATPIEIASEPTAGCDMNTPIDGFSWAATDGTSSGTVINYVPVLATPLVTNPAVPGIVTDFSYVRSATQPDYDANNVLTNAQALGSGTVTVTATAPQGYGFGGTLASTQSWTLPYFCQSAGSGGGGSGGNN